MTWGRTRRGPRSIYADNSGSEEERAAGGAMIEIELWSIYRWLMQRTEDALLTS